MVLEAGGRRLLLGVTAQQVCLLVDLAAGATAPASHGVPHSDPVPVTPWPATPPRSAALPPIAPRAPRAAGPRSVPIPEPVADLPSAAPLTRRAARQAAAGRRLAMPPTQRGSGSVVDPRTWQQGLEALRDLTARRG